MATNRIGIYSGTFDPVHAGHISFAVQAMKTAKLDKVIFLPERQPRGKESPEHFGHRTAMITRAIRPHTNFALLELPDINFNVSKTLPKLKNLFPKSKLVLLIGSDVAINLKSWPDSDKLLNQCELVIGLRRGAKVSQVIEALEDVKQPVTIIESTRPYISSRLIRESLRLGKWAAGLLPSVKRYAKSQWLYTSLD